MESTVKRYITAKQMENLFDKVNVRHFTAMDFNGADYNPNYKYVYNIILRHSEEEDPEEIITNALKD